MEIPNDLPDSLWGEAWKELYRVYSERLDQENVDLMNSVLNTVVNDVMEFLDADIRKGLQELGLPGGLFDV